MGIMSAALVYLKMELKRACRKLPHVISGAIVLVCLLGTIAFLSGKMLYGNAALGRMEIGVVLPEDDGLAKQVITMVSSLESVKSLCDFTYLDKETGLARMRKGDLYAVMELPQGFVLDIMNGTNTPVTVWLPENAWLESLVFKELTDAGARTLSSSQAGIYAGDELCTVYGLDSSIRSLERDLNEIYLGYSLPRSDYFRHQTVSAVEDVGVFEFYLLSASVLLLLLCGIPACSYLVPYRRGMKQKLSLIGIGRTARVCARTAGMGALIACVGVPLVLAAAAARLLTVSLPGAVAFLLLCLGIASVLVLVFQLSSSLMGGVMLLFMAGIFQHFLSGGFLPPVFLPETVRQIGSFLPSAIWMEGGKMMMTGIWNPAVLWGLLAVPVVCVCISVGLEGER